MKALVVPAPGHQPGPTLEKALIAHCAEHLIKWSCPREVEFRDSLPLTLVGKVDFRRIKEEEQARRAAARVAG